MRRIAGLSGAVINGKSFDDPAKLLAFLCALVFGLIGFAQARLLVNNTFLLVARQSIEASAAIMLAVWASAVAIAGFGNRAAEKYLRPIDPARSREVRAEARIARIAAQIGVVCPRLAISTRYRARDCWVQGLRRPYLLVIESIFLRWLDEDPVTFDAAIAHEFFHLIRDDARWAALGRALVIPSQLLSFATLGVPLARQFAMVLSFAPHFSVAPSIAFWWVAQTLLSCMTLFLIPAAVAALSLRYVFAYLAHRNEYGADRFAYLNGFPILAFFPAQSLPPISRGRLACRRIIGLLSLLRHTPLPAERHARVREARHVNRASGADYLFTGFSLAVIVSFFQSAHLSNATDIADTFLSTGNFPTLQQYGVFNLVLGIFFLATALAVVVTLQKLFIRDLTTASASGKPRLLLRSLVSATVLVCGFEIGCFVWPDNLRVLSNPFLNVGTSTSSVAGLGTIGNTLLSTTPQNVLALILVLNVCLALYGWFVLLYARRVRYKPWRAYTMPLIIFAWIDASSGNGLLFWIVLHGSASAFQPLEQFFLVVGLIYAAILALVLCLLVLWRRRRAAHAEIVIAAPPNLPEPTSGRSAGRQIRPRAVAHWRMPMLAGAFLVVAGTLSYAIPQILESRTLLIRPVSPAAEPAAHRLVQEFQNFYNTYTYSSLPYPTILYIPPRGEAASFRQKLEAVLANGEVRNPPHRIRIEVSMIGGKSFVQLRNPPDSYFRQTFPLIDDRSFAQFVTDVNDAEFPYFSILARTRLVGVKDASLVFGSSILRWWPRTDAQRAYYEIYALQHKVNRNWSSTDSAADYALLIREKQTLEDISATLPDLPPVWETLSGVYDSLGLADASKDAAQHAVETAPDNPVLRDLYAKKLMAEASTNGAQTGRDVAVTCRELAIAIWLAESQRQQFYYILNVIHGDQKTFGCNTME